MSKKSELVKQFVATIEETLAVDAARYPKNTSWPTKGTRMRIGSLAYEHARAGAGRSSTLGIKGERWGLIETRRRVEGYSGSVAVMAAAGRTSTLERRWEIASPLTGIGIASISYLNKVEELETAVGWAQSPQLRHEGLEEIFALSEDEQEKVSRQYEELRQSRVELDKDLNSLAEARQSSWAHMADVHLD